MLRALRIQNFALIDALDLSFQNGFTVITGETGSGKSILLGALNLILGERSDFSLIGPSSDKAIVEVDYELADKWESFFKLNDLDFERLTTIRREILSSGKSRAFINDTPVQLSVLKQLSLQLVSIHSQYNTLELKNPDYQLQLLDILAQLKGDRNVFEEQYSKWKTINTELEKLKSLQLSADQRIDYLSFQVEELAELQLDKVDYTEIEAEFNLIESAEEIQRIMVSLHNAIDEDGAIHDQLVQLNQLVAKYSASTEELGNMADRLKSAAVELSDIAKEAMRLNERLDAQPQRLIELEDKLNRYNHVLRKHHALDQKALIEMERNFKEELKTTSGDIDRIQELEKEVDQAYSEMIELAEVLHQKRLNSTSQLSGELKTILNELKLPETQLTFEVTKRPSVSSSGISDLSILFSANKGMVPVPVQQAASGGELSRLMLALQKMVSAKMKLPTILFDEIDTGVSGEVADKIGRLLHEMGKEMQLMAITHLPQVASKGMHHLKVEKSIQQDITVTRVRELSGAEREIEIARLMSGEEISDAAIHAARQLMNK